MQGVVWGDAAASAAVAHLTDKDSGSLPVLRVAAAFGEAFLQEIEMFQKTRINIRSSMKLMIFISLRTLGIRGDRHPGLS